MAATTTKQSLNTNTSPFNFLKEGLLLHSHNRRLFASIFAIYVVSNSLFLLAYELGVQPFAFNVSHDLYALNHTSPRTPRYTHLLRQLHGDSRSLLLANVFYLVSGLIFSSITELLAVFAAVTTRSGESHTFATLLGRAKAQLKGPVLTVAFVYLLHIFSIALLSAMAVLFVFLALRRYLGLLLVDGLVLLVAYSLYVYVSFVCSLAVVVAVAEPGSRGGAGAVWRAWRLVKGSLGRAMILVSVMGVLAVVFSPFYWLAKICSLSKMVSGAMLLRFLYAVQMAAVELFGVCAMTAFYYECKERDQQEDPEMEYLKLLPVVQDV